MITACGEIGTCRLYLAYIFQKSIWEHISKEVKMLVSFDSNPTPWILSTGNKRKNSILEDVYYFNIDTNKELERTKILNSNKNIWQIMVQILHWVYYTIFKNIRMNEKLNGKIQTVCSTSKYYDFYDIYSMRCIMLILQHNTLNPLKPNFSVPQ